LSEDEWKYKLVYAGQDIDNPDVCQTFNQIKQRNPGNNEANRQARERDFANCAKINGNPSPYLNAGVIKAGQPGNYAFMSTRNNNFSNRQQKAYLTIEPKKSVGAKIGIAVGVIAGIGVAGVVASYGMKSFSGNSLSSKDGSNSDNFQVSIGNGGAGATSSATALYDHDAKEPGELSFKKGQTIKITEKDKSGWWTGSTSDGQSGIFPANYVKI